MTTPNISHLHQRVTAMIARWRAKPHNTDRVNRAAGRAEVIIARHCARLGEPLPTLYVSARPRKLQQIAGEATTELWLTTWPGNRVAQLKATGTAHAYGGDLTCYGCVIEGRYYHGRGLGEGMYINMRPGRVIGETRRYVPSKVSSKYGAPMGRSSTTGRDLDPECPPGKLHLQRLRLNAGGYDSGGAYWGLALPIYVATDFENVTVFVRGVTRNAAKMAVRRALPMQDGQLEFYR